MKRLILAVILAAAPLAAQDILVVDGTGKPVANAAVEIWPRYGACIEMETDRRGAFELPPINRWPDDPWGLVARDTVGGVAIAEKYDRKRQLRGHRMTLERGLRAHLAVTGTPDERVRVEIVALHGGPVFRGEVRVQPSIPLPPLPAGTYTVAVSDSIEKRGRAGLVLRGGAGDPPRVEVELRHTRNMTLRLVSRTGDATRGPRLDRIKQLDVSGDDLPDGLEPVVGVEIRTRVTGLGPLPRSDENGRIEVRGVTDKMRSFSLLVPILRQAWASVKWRDGEAVLEIPRPPSPFVSWDVGEGVRGPIEVRRLVRGERGETTSVAVKGGRMTLERHVARVNSAGFLARAASGHVALVIHDRFSEAQGDAGFAKPSRLELKLRTAEGRPVANAPVRLEVGDLIVAQAVADGEGIATFEGLPPEVTMTAIVADYRRGATNRTARAEVGAPGRVEVIVTVQ